MKEFQRGRETEKEQEAARASERNKVKRREKDTSSVDPFPKWVKCPAWSLSEA